MSRGAAFCASASAAARPVILRRLGIEDGGSGPRRGSGAEGLGLRDGDFGTVAAGPVHSGAMSDPSPATERFAVIAVVPPGLEEVAAAELAELGAEAVQPLRRAVACRTDLAGFYRLHLRARLPFRCLRELARFPCRNRRELRQGVQAAADWRRWLPPERSFKVEASGSLPELNHSHYSALEVKNALVDLQRQLWGERSTVDLQDPDLVLHLHLSPGRAGDGYGRGPGESNGGTAILSLEGGGGGGGHGGGGSLHRRGYRAAMGLAPLKENLAAGLIALTGWDGSVPLVDPLCGSGTLLLEAAALALARAPGLEAAGVGTDDPASGAPLITDAAGWSGWPLSSAGSTASLDSGRADGVPSAAPRHAAGGNPAGIGAVAAPSDEGAAWTEAVRRGNSGPASPAAAPRPRAFGFRRWPDFDAALWDREVASAVCLERSGLADGRALAPILGLERDPAVLQQARANAAAAGLSGAIGLQQGDFRDLVPPPGPGLLVCNPPYGLRLGADDDLEALYSDLGRVVRERCSGWTLWLLSGNADLTGALRMKASRRIPVSNGGLDCRWLRYEIR